MQFNYLLTLLAIGLLTLFSACTHDHPHNPDGSHPEDAHDHATHDHANHDHGSHAENTHEMADISVTERTDFSELFIKFQPLIIGKTTSFAAHFSDIKTFKPIAEGTLTLRWIQNGKTVLENTINAPSSPGIFSFTHTPEYAGVFELACTLNTASFSDKITVSDITVYPNEEAAMAENPSKEDDENTITFLKEQAWKTTFGIAKVNRATIHDVIRTSGEIQSVSGTEKVVSAKSNGVVFYKNSKLQEGREVRKGEVLFTMSSEGLLTSSITEKINIAKAKLEKTKANFERAERLMSEQIIGQKEYENRKMEFAIAEAEWQTLSNTNNRGGQTLTAPMSGIIKKLLIKDGEFAAEGTPLIEITNTRRLMLHADLALNYRPMLAHIVSANFKTPYQDEVQSLADYNGKLVSAGKVLESGKHFLPVWFELDNVNDLVPGSFVELFLLTKPIPNQLVIPNTALMQDYDVNYVYVQVSGERFEKREVQLGINDGKNVQILSGVSEGDWVVTDGAYQIKMASMSSSIPAHGHAH